MALKREFAEETGLIVDVGRLLFVYEFLALPLHAIDLFFDVRWVGGVLQTGADPEMGATEQTITDARFMHYDDINALPATDVHALVGGCSSLDELFRQTGYINQL